MAVNVNAGVGTEIATALRNSSDGDHEQIVVAGSHLVRVQVTPVINTSAYATGDCLGGLMEITNAARFTGGGGYLKNIVVLDKTQAQRAAMDFVFFRQSVTVAGNNSPFATSDTDMEQCLGFIPLVAGDYATAFPGTPLNSIGMLSNSENLPYDVTFPYLCASTSLFCQAIVRGTPTYTAATDLVFTFLLQPN